MVVSTKHTGSESDLERQVKRRMDVEPDSDVDVIGLSQPVEHHAVSFMRDAAAAKLC